MKRFFCVKKNDAKLSLFSLSFLLIHSCLFAQMNNYGLDASKKLSQYTIDYYSTNEGLPNNAVLHLEKSEDGYMWFATFDGLARFDGISFKTFNKFNNDVITSNAFLTISKSKHGGLWIGTNGGGLLYLKDNEFEIIEKLSDHAIISASFEDENGVLWLGTRNGVYKYENDELIYIDELDFLGNTYVSNLLVDSKYNIWIATSGLGVIKYSRNKEITRFTKKSGLPSDNTQCIYEDESGVIWIGTNNGLVKIDGEKLSATKIGKGYAENVINVIYKDLSGNFWVGTDLGLYRYKNKIFESFPSEYHLSSANIRRLYEDNEGNLWTANYRSGVAKIRDGKFTNFGTMEGLPNNTVNCTLNDNDILWIGTDNGLVYYEDGEMKNFPLREGLERIRFLFKDKSGDIWVAIYGGLVRIRNEKVIKIYTLQDGLKNDRVRVVGEDKKGEIWIGTTDGLFIMDKERVNISEFENKLPDTFIMSIFLDSKNNFWVGTNGGGFFKIVDNQINPYGISDGLAGNVIFNMYEDFENDVLWICTNGGLSTFNGKEIFSFGEKNEILYNGIFQLLDDQTGNFWLTSGKGVVKIRKSELYNLTISPVDKVLPFTFFNKYDGMRSSEITGASTSSVAYDGNLWFCTFSGASVYNPQSSKISNFRTPTIIEKVISDLETYDVLSENSIELPPQNDRLEIHFTGLGFHEPKSIDFKYKLEGFDDEWRLSQGERKTSYTNLSPGTYTFKVKASNNDGIWNDNGDELVVIQTPSFYQIYWVNILFIFCTIGIIVLIVRKRAYNLRMLNDRLSILVEKRTNEVVEKNLKLDITITELEASNKDLKRFAYIASHDLKSPLRGIAMMVEFILADNYSNLDENGRTQLSLLQSRVTRMSNLIDGILTYSRAGTIEANKKQINLNEILTSIIELISPPDHFSIKIVDKLPVIVEDEAAIQQLFQNLLTNAIKFNDKEKGIITVRYVDKDGRHNFQISDNGLGIEVIHYDKIFDIFQTVHNEIESTGIGLSIVKKIIENLNGEISVKSELGVGTTFSFSWVK